MVLRTGERREEEKLEDIDRKLALDNLYIAQNRLFPVVGETDDIAGIGHDAGTFPRLQHGTVVGDLVLTLLGAEQAVRIDILQADKGAIYAGAPRFFDEIRNLVAQRIHLNDELDVQTLILSQPDQFVEEAFPVAVAREIVIGDEKPVDALRVVVADRALKIIRSTEPALAALHVDDGAEGALERAAAAKINAGMRPRGTPNVLLGQDRRRLVVERRQILHVIVKRFEFATKGVDQHFVETSLLGLPGIKTDAQLLGFLQILGQLRQHRDAARNVEATDGDLDAGIAESSAPGPLPAGTDWIARRPARPIRGRRRVRSA